MISTDPQASLKYFRSIASHADRDVQRRLDRFQRSLQTWLHSALNWPQDDWEADLRLFVEHTRYAGWEISPHSLAKIRELLEARATRAGQFAVAPLKRDARPPIQLAAVAIAPGEDTDATLDLTTEDEGDVEDPVELETAGPGPEVSDQFKAKVQALLKILDAVAAEVWETEGGIVRSRDASGPWLNYYSERIDGHPAIIVDQSFTVSDTVLAILEEAYASRANPIRSEMLRRWISGDGAAVRLREIQTQAYKEAAAEAAMIAEMYYGTLASLTPGGDLVVTLDDIERNGPSLNHALILLPALAYPGKRGTGLVLKIAGGRAFRVPAELVEKLSKLPKAALDKLAAKVREAKTSEEAINIIKKGTSTKSNAKPKPIPKKLPKKSPTKPAPKSLKPPGEWRNIPENMRDRARTYQAQITGRRNQVYLAKGVKFDGYKNGVLIECKGPGYLDFIRKSDGTFYYWFAASELEQARRQLNAAAGAPIEWIVAEPELKQALESMFEIHGITGIPIRVVPVR